MDDGTIYVGHFVPNTPTQNLGGGVAVWRPHPWLSSDVFGPVSDAGLKINQDIALSHTPLWHGLLLLGGDVGSLEIELKRKQGEQKVSVTDHVAYNLAAVKPNMLMCPSTFWETMVIRAILHGNALCEIKRDRSGRPLPLERGGGLELLPPETTFPEFDDMGKLWIKTRLTHPDFTTEERLIDPDDTFHLPSLSTDGFWGRALIDVAKNRLGSGLGLEKQHNRFMQNGMQPDWLFSYPVQLDPEDAIAIEERLKRRNRGLDNAGRSLVLDNDVKAEQLGMNFETAQFAELVQLDVKMVSSLLGIPAVMLNSMEAMTFSNTEESERWYINRTLRRWLNKIHQELRTKLLTDREKVRMSFCHILWPLLMGRLSERYAAYSQGISSRILNPNEVRALEGLNPYEGGDEYANPNTMSGGQPNEEDDDSQEPEEPQEDQSDQQRAAALLKPILKREDYEVSEACRRERNIVKWLDDYYHSALLPEMYDVVPKSAGDYCTGRFGLWLKFANHVDTSKRLGEIVKAQAQTQSDRLAGILTAEYLS